MRSVGGVMVTRATFRPVNDGHRHDWHTVGSNEVCVHCDVLRATTRRRRAAKPTPPRITVTMLDEARGQRVSLLATELSQSADTWTRAQVEHLATVVRENTMARFPNSVSADDVERWRAVVNLDLAHWIDNAKKGAST